MRISFVTSLILSLVGLASLLDTARAQDAAEIKKSLIFHAPFDGSADATKSRGNGKIFTAESLARKQKTPGLVRPHVELAKGQGKFGDCLRFTDKTPQVLCFEGSEVPYRPTDWSTTISFWMKLNPDQDLKPGYCDPIQVTEKAWNDAAIFVDFDKDLPRDFRLGVFSNLSFWNPDNTPWEKWPVDKRPMVTVKRPPFSRTSWTHVLLTLDHVNAASDGVATLYLNGHSQGSIQQPLKFTWDPEQAAIMLGIEYIGDLDDLMIFDRALTAAEASLLANEK